jgi:hypothetical protein
VIFAVAAALAGAALGAAPSTQILHSRDTRLCPFTLDVTVVRRLATRRVGTKELQLVGPTTVTLRNASTGRTAALRAAGSATLDAATGTTSFSGPQLWLGPENHVPYLSTEGRQRRPRVIDPCVFVAPARPALAPGGGRAPWPLPSFPLSRIAAAGLVPVTGALIRHDHVHLDVIVERRPVTIPAGVGQVEPVDRGPGPCPPPPESRSIGDCAPGHFFTAAIALSPLHPHSTSGIVHIEADRPGTFRLGQFFDEWGVRFDASCVGAYCSGAGKELRVYVDGRRVSGDPRRLVLGNRQEIAVVFGGAGDFGSVPSEYAKQWPAGCGGHGEPSCLSRRP